MKNPASNPATKQSFRSGGILVLGTLLVLAFVVFRFQGREPVYHGRSLSSWFIESEAMPNVVEGAPPTKAIQAMGAAAVPYLAARVQREDGWWTRFYWERWPKLSPRLKKILPLPHRPDARQETAAMLLSALGPGARAATPEMLAAYENAYKKRFHLSRGATLDWPAQLANPPASLLPGGLPPAPEGSLRWMILLMLSQIGGDDPRIVPILLTAIREPNQSFQSGLPYWTKGNTNLLPAIKLSEPFLLAALHDSEPKVRLTAANLLCLLLPEHGEVVACLLAAANDPDAAVRENAVEALAKTAVPLETILPMMDSWLHDPQPGTRRFAMQLLMKSGGGGAHVFSRLQAALSDSNAPSRAEAAKLLGMFGARSRAAAPKLRELADPAREPDEQVRHEAAEALKHMEPATSQAPPAKPKD